MHGTLRFRSDGHKHESHAPGSTRFGAPGRGAPNWGRRQASHQNNPRSGMKCWAAGDMTATLRDRDQACSGKTARRPDQADRRFMGHRTALAGSWQCPAGPADCPASIRAWSASLHSPSAVVGSGSGRSQCGASTLPCGAALPGPIAACATLPARLSKPAQPSNQPGELGIGAGVTDGACATGRCCVLRQ